MGCGYWLERYPDPVRANIVESWASSMDDTTARADWDWTPEFDLEQMTDAVLADELNLSDTEINRVRAEGVLGQRPEPPNTPSQEIAR